MGRRRGGCDVVSEEEVEEREKGRERDLCEVMIRGMEGLVGLGP